MYGPRMQKAAAMAAESSTARLTLSSYRQLERKGRPRVAAEIQCTRCERRVTRASGEEPKGELCGLAQSRAAGVETARPARAGAPGWRAGLPRKRSHSIRLLLPTRGRRPRRRPRSVEGALAYPLGLRCFSGLGNDRVSSHEYRLENVPVYQRDHVRI